MRRFVAVLAVLAACEPPPPSAAVPGPVPSATHAAAPSGPAPSAPASPAQDAPPEMKRAMECINAGDLAGATPLFEKALGKGHAAALPWIERCALHRHRHPPLAERGWPAPGEAPAPRTEPAAENEFLKADREAKEKAATDPAAAEKLFAAIEATYPASTEAAHNRAVCLALQGKWADALEAAKKSTIDHPARHHVVAGALLEAGKLDEALESAGRAVQGAAQAKPAWVRRAAIYEKLGKIDECLGDLQVALGLDPDDDALREKRLSLHAKKGDPAAGLQDLEALIAKSKDPALILRRARLLVSIGNASQALGDYNALVEQRPEDFDLRLERADARKVAAQYTDARDDLTWCIGRKPSAALYAKRAQIEIEQHRWQSAEPDLKKAIELDAACFNAWYWKGWMHKEKREIAAANEAFAKCAELDPKNGDTWYHWSQVLGHLRQYEKALEAILKAKELCPKDMQDNIDYLMRAAKSRVDQLHKGAVEAAWKFIDKSGAAKEYLKESASVAGDGDAWIVTFKKAGQKPESSSVKVNKKTLDAAWK